MTNFKEIIKFIKTILLYSLIPILVIALVCYKVDAFNTMHPLNVRMNGNEVNKNYVKTKYLISNPNKFDSIIIGSSRIGNIHVENIKNQRCYNMYYGKGVPKENLETIKELIRNDCGIKNIYLGVDSYSYTEDYTIHNSEPIRASYTYLRKHPLKFIEMYFDLSIAFKTITNPEVEETEENRSSDIFYKYGWNHNYGEISKYDFSNAKPMLGSAYYLDETIKDIKEIRTLCDKNNINLVVFTNPMYYVTYEESLNYNYYDFLIQLSKVTPYYNFSGYNDISVNSDNYYETSHYKAETSDLLIEILWNNKTYEELLHQGFGYYVTENNVEELITLLVNERENYINK